MERSLTHSPSPSGLRRVTACAARLAIAAVLFSAVENRGQPAGAGAVASDFVSIEYYDAPHQRQIKSRMSGAEALPQAGGLLLIKQLRLETFSPDGKPEIVADAPGCVYDPLKGTARSPGPLRVRTGDGKFRIEGEGFSWRQNDSVLTISNRVETVIESAGAIGP